MFSFDAGATLLKGSFLVANDRNCELERTRRVGEARLRCRNKGKAVRLSISFKL